MSAIRDRIRDVLFGKRELARLRNENRDLRMRLTLASDDANRKGDRISVLENMAAADPVRALHQLEGFRKVLGVLVHQYDEAILRMKRIVGEG